MWGLIELADRPGDYVFLVTFGRREGEHEFDEGVTTEGLLRWQSQPKQDLADRHVRHIFAPNSAHWTHLIGWHNACPAALVWAAPGVARKLTRARLPVPLRAELGETPPEDWAGQIDQAVFRGCGGFVEIAFFHRASATLMLADTVQALEPTRLPLPTRLFANATGATRGETPATLRWRLGGAAHRAIR